MIRKKTYQEIFADVCRYVSSVANSEIHATKKRVLHWDEYANALMSAKALSFEWTNSIAAELISLPNNILDQDISIKSNFDLADSICSKLIHKPDDEKLKNTLNDTIGYIQLDLSPICAQIQKVLTLLHKYHDTLPSQANKLQEIADWAMDDKKTDEEKVKTLMNDLEQAKAEVSRLSAAIVGLGIAIGGSVILSILSFAVAGPWGALSLIFTGAAIATASTFIVIDSQKIKALKSKIEVDQDDIDEYTSDVVQLQAMSSIYRDLANKALEMEECINFISGAWKAMQNDLEDIKIELSTAEGRIRQKTGKIYNTILKKHPIFGWTSSRRPVY